MPTVTCDIVPRCLHMCVLLVGLGPPKNVLYKHLYSTVHDNYVLFFFRLSLIMHMLFNSAVDVIDTDVYINKSR